MARHILSVYIDDKNFKELTRITDGLGVSKSSFALQLIEEGMKRFRGESEGITPDDIKRFYRYFEQILQNTYGSTLASFHNVEIDKRQELIQKAEKYSAEFVDKTNQKQG